MKELPVVFVETKSLQRFIYSVDTGVRKHSLELTQRP